MSFPLVHLLFYIKSPDSASTLFVSSDFHLVEKPLSSDNLLVSTSCSTATKVRFPVTLRVLEPVS